MIELSIPHYMILTTFIFSCYSPFSQQC